jgi:hypothetical protein
MGHLYADPRVTLITEASVSHVELSGGTATGVAYRAANRDATARADLIVLGANALFNPHILLRSGLDHPLLGRRLHEQVSVGAIIDLDGADNYNGSTSITGHGYMLYDGEHRRERAACLIESLNTPHASNLPALRPERGKWRQRLVLKFIFEDLPSEDNRVMLDPANPARPLVVHGPRSAYAQRGIDALPAADRRPLPGPARGRRGHRRPPGHVRGAHPGHDGHGRRPGDERHRPPPHPPHGAQSHRPR